METIKEIKIITDLGIGFLHGLNGKDGARLGMMQMMSSVFREGSTYDGYEVITDKHSYKVLIDNQQSCCESWGYLASEDNNDAFIGAELIEVKLTDVALNQKVVEESDYYVDAGGIQFVDFVTDKGVLQLAVYNGHNGYYGHGIIVAKDENVLLDDVL